MSSRITYLTLGGRHYHAVPAGQQKTLCGLKPGKGAVWLPQEGPAATCRICLLIMVKAEQLEAEMKLARDWRPSP